MKYTFEQINDICKQPDIVENILNQNQVLRNELGEILKRVQKLEKENIEIKVLVNELNISSC